MKQEYDFSKAKRGPVIPVPKGKTRITIRLDGDLIHWFRKQVEEAGGGNYQSLINNTPYGSTSPTRTNRWKKLSDVSFEKNCGEPVRPRSRPYAGTPIAADRCCLPVTGEWAVFRPQGGLRPASSNSRLLVQLTGRASWPRRRLLFGSAVRGIGQRHPRGGRFGRAPGRDATRPGPGKRPVLSRTIATQKG